MTHLDEDFNPQELTEYSEDQLINLYEQMQADAEEVASALSEIRDLLKIRLESKNLKSSVIGEYSITLYSTTRFKTTVEQARELAATDIITEEKINTKRLKTLADAGVNVPGQEVSENIRISRIKA